ncbi:MAG TPA: hypothetical protein VK858_17795 [Longimicrobiales bacterium]|nr:hypothetical protein [Longimicrobiales bacterium]
MVSEIFDASAWREVPGFEDLSDVTYHRSLDQRTVRIAFDRPECRNAFRPRTVDELFRTLEHARTSSKVGCVLFMPKIVIAVVPGWAEGTASTSSAT